MLGASWCWMLSVSVGGCCAYKCCWGPQQAMCVRGTLGWQALEILSVRKSGAPGSLAGQMLSTMAICTGWIRGCSVCAAGVLIRSRPCLTGYASPYRLDKMDASTTEARAAKLLHGLGFNNRMQKQKTRDFSGGWRMRIALARSVATRDMLL